MLFWLILNESDHQIQTLETSELTLRRKFNDWQLNLVASLQNGCNSSCSTVYDIHWVTLHAKFHLIHFCIFRVHNVLTDMKNYTLRSPYNQ